jgi:16S rRNA (adenine1518-N6/adenine1519-N6)-dimethyltransferase
MPPKPKKSLGQNFLVDKNILAKISRSAQFSSDDLVVEIGAGRGELTRFLSETAGSGVALELDKRLTFLLKESLGAFRNLTVMQQDVLAFDFQELSRRYGKKIKVVGNIPYYISSPIISHLLVFRPYIEEIFLTVQQEFAERIAAPEGSKTYGSLSIYVQYYTEPKLLFLIPRTCFRPAPQVDSAFIKLTPRKSLPLSDNDEKELFRITRKAFQQRRKKLSNSLSGVIAKEKLTAFFRTYSINPSIRPEEMSVDDFIKLASWTYPPIL